MRGTVAFLPVLGRRMSKVQPGGTEEEEGEEKSETEGPEEDTGAFNV